MICCKITADFRRGGNVGGLLRTLGALGEVLVSESGEVYFADIDDPKSNGKTISRALRKNGYTAFFIEEYGKENAPREAYDYVNGWILGRLARINYRMYGIENRKMIQNTMKALDEIDAELAAIAESGGKETKEGE